MDRRTLLVAALTSSLFTAAAQADGLAPVPAARADVVEVVAIDALGRPQVEIACGIRHVLLRQIIGGAERHVMHRAGTLPAR